MDHELNTRGKHELLADYLNRIDPRQQGRHEARGPTPRITGEFSHFDRQPTQASITYSGVDAITEDDVFRLRDDVWRNRIIRPSVV